MAIYRVEGPDGSIHRIEGPDGATPKQVEAFAHQQFAAQAAPTPTEPEVKPDTGFTGALKSSTEQIQADWERLKGKVGV